MQRWWLRTSRAGSWPGLLLVAGLALGGGCTREAGEPAAPPPPMPPAVPPDFGGDEVDPEVRHLVQVAEAWRQVAGERAYPDPHVAAWRLLRAPELAGDVIAFARRPDGEPGDAVTRVLPGGHTVASLIEDFGFSVPGAFLVAAELMVDPAVGEALLDRYIEQGYRRRHADGVSYRVYPPVAARYPACAGCGMHSRRTLDACPRCGYGRLQRLIEEGEVPPEIRERIESRRSPAS